jgi:hypothetical protein
MKIDYIIAESGGCDETQSSQHGQNSHSVHFHTLNKAASIPKRHTGKPLIKAFLPK